MSHSDIINAKIKTIKTLLATEPGVKYFSPRLEKEYQLNYLKKYLYSIRLVLVLGFFLFYGGAYIIFLFFPNWQFPFDVTVYIGLPILLILIILSFTSLYFKFLQLIMFFFSITILICLAIIAAVAPMPLKDLVYQGMLLPSLYVSTLGNLQFRYSVLLMVVVLVTSNISYHYSGFLASHNYYSFIVSNYILFGGTYLCSVSSYFNECHQRTQFLFVKLINLKNELLEQRSNHDPRKSSSIYYEPLLH